MLNSVLDAIKSGIWDFEPEQQPSDDYDPTDALPGTDEKLTILAERVRRGLPLWHPSDRITYNDQLRDYKTQAAPGPGMKCKCAGKPGRWRSGFILVYAA